MRTETPKTDEPPSQPPEMQIPEPQTAQELNEPPKEEQRPIEKQETTALASETITEKPEVPEQTEISAPATETRFQPQVAKPAPLIEQPTETAVAPPISKKEEHYAAQALIRVYPIVDALFDILWKLHGKVDWDIIKKNVENIDDEAKKTDQSTLNQKLSMSTLAEAAEQGNTNEASKEAFKILISLNEAFNGLASTDSDSPQTRMQYAAAKDMLNAYYVLNDIILAIVVGDPTVKDETNQLLTILDNFETATNFKLDIENLINALNKIESEPENQENIANCRALFKNQFESILPTLESLSSPLTKTFLP